MFANTIYLKVKPCRLLEKIIPEKFPRNHKSV